MPLNPMTRFSLTMQGFVCDVPAFGPIAPWLRWTPTLSTIFIFLGTILRDPYILWAFAVIAFVGAAGWNAFDALFNYGVRFVLQLPRLPPNPAPRRFAMGLAATWAAVVGVLFATGWTQSGLVAGILLLIAAVLVATTQFCIGSLVWRLLNRRPVGVAN